MPMTRELKKRFMSVEERILKLEKRKPGQQTNGEDLSERPVNPGDTESRLENIEAVLQMPGEKVGDTQILSAWREIIESKLISVGEKLNEFHHRLEKIETVLVIPGEEGFLSGFANKVDQVFTSVKDRLTKLEKTGPIKRTPAGAVKDLEERVKHLTQETNDNRPVIKKLGERVNLLETKPVAGALSQVTGKMVDDIDGNTKEVKALRGMIRVLTWFTLGLVALTLILTALTLT